MLFQNILVPVDLSTQSTRSFKVALDIAKKDAEIRIEEAKGIAEAQKIINATLTKNYL